MVRNTCLCLDFTDRPQCPFTPPTSQSETASSQCNQIILLLYQNKHWKLVPKIPSEGDEYDRTIV